MLRGGEVLRDKKFSQEEWGRAFHAKGLHAPLVPGLMPEEAPRKPPPAEPASLSLPRSRSCTCCSAAPSSLLTSGSTLRNGHGLSPARDP